MLARKIMQQDIFLVSLLTDTRLKENEGTQRTLVRVRVEETLTVPMWVTVAKLPFGNLTKLETNAMMVVKYDVEQTIWSVAPVYRIQGQFLDVEAL
jgi:hypothetical protein